MRDETKQARMIEIEEVAYKLVEERGYSGVSMLMIAKAAKASNETLYRWYGDKKGMFRVMVDRNAARVTDVLRNTSETGDPLEELRILAPRLLAMVLGDRAVVLNRAAAGDPTHELGRAIAAGGRDHIAPRIGKLISRAQASGQLRALDVALVCDVFIRLLIGDLQNRRVIGSIAKLSDKEVKTRASEACALFERMWAPKTH